MIVPMKKVTILCRSAERDKTVETLGDLGVVHVEHISQPSGEALERARKRLSDMERALDNLPRSGQAPPSGRNPDRVVDSICARIEEKKELEETIEDLERESSRLEPFGSFDPASIRHLADKGVSIKLIRVEPKQKISVPEGAVMKEISRDKEGTAYAVISRGDVAIDARELPLPTSSLSEIRKRIVAARHALDRNAEQMENHAGDRGAVTEILHDARDTVQFIEAREGMASNGKTPIAFLKGYCPGEAMDEIRNAARYQGWGIVTTDPEPEDKVPSLIRNPRWIRPIETVFNMIGIIPGYREVDISPSFLIFLSLFFAMLVGDAGYGVLFLGLTWFARRKAPKAPSQSFAFLYIMSASTIAWGVITGNYFGYFGPVRPLPDFLRLLTIPWFVDAEFSQKNIMLFCFFIGSLHLTVAHAWNVVRMINTLQALAHVGWICTTWVMFYAARYMVLGDPFPTQVLWLLGAGTLFIVLFMTPVHRFKTEWFNHAILPLNIIGNFTDVVSYVRLFAVGSASYAVANAFNDMLLEGGQGDPEQGTIFLILGGLVKALLLFAGHALNIGLCCLGILVHGVRLNTLEFSSHIGLQWSGFAFEPLSRRRKADSGKVSSR